MKDPAILFYTSDFLTGTMFFTDEQVGKYMRLLCAQHQMGRLTEKHMLKICQTYDKDIWDKFVVDGDGLFYNERLEVETEKRRNYCESRSKNRKSVTKPKNICRTYDKHMENENRNEDIDINIREDEFKKKVKTLNDEHGILKDIEKFVNYWTESSGKKLRYEKEKTFDLKKRMERWKMNQKDWGVEPEPAVEKKLNFAN